MSKRVLLLGATGSIGRAVAQSLTTAGHEVVALCRADVDAAPGVTTRTCDFVDPASVREHGFGGPQIDAVISCMASRTGAPADAWAVDYQAHLNVLRATQRAGTAQFILLSAICVQKPKLAFQQAKLTFEDALIGSGLTWSIVRPTAYFKSLAGQIARVQAGKPYLLFGDGRLTACKPISDGDLAAYIVSCLSDTGLQNRILPIGGPAPALTPLEMGEELFRLTGQPAKYRHVPVAMMDVIIGGLSLVGRFSPKAAAKAELARIGRYYATESMLVWDQHASQYDAAATPEFGSATLFGYYRKVIAGEATVERGDHAVF